MQKYNPDLHHRRSIRLRGYDYANAGAYFVTICLNQRVPKTLQHNALQIYKEIPTFGNIENEKMILNDCGKMIEKWISKIKDNADKFSNIYFNEYIIMPDHIHAIIRIAETNTDTVIGTDLRVCPDKKYKGRRKHIGLPQQNRTPQSVKLSTVIQWFKTMTSNEYINNVKNNNWIPFNKRLWQHNYYERIIRNETEYEKITRYICNNPVLWRKGCLNTFASKPATGNFSKNI